MEENFNTRKRKTKNMEPEKTNKSMVPEKTKKSMVQEEKMEKIKTNFFFIEYEGRKRQHIPGLYSIYNHKYCYVFTMESKVVSILK